MSNKPELKFKILIIGNSAVGKTSMLLKYTENRFPEAHIATIGVEFKVKIIETDKYKVQLNIWDTAGQERFKSLTKSFYNHTNGIIYVYDITNYETFEGVKNWMNEAEPYGIHESIYPVGRLPSRRADPSHRAQCGKTDAGRTRGPLLRHDHQIIHQRLTVPSHCPDEALLLLFHNHRR